MNRDQIRNPFLAAQTKKKASKACDFNPANADDFSAASADGQPTSARASNTKLRAIQLADCTRPAWLCLWDNLMARPPQRQPQATLQGENSIEAQGNLTASRTRYLVQNGDTLESIASNQLGAARLAGLLITINRGIIDFVVVNGKTVPSIRATQVIILPSASELAIHKKQYFTKHSLHPEAPDTVPWTRDNSTGSADKSGDTNDLSFSPTTFNHAAPRPVTRATAADSPQAQAQPLRPRRRHHQVLAGDTLQSIALHDHLMADVDSWILVAKLNNLITTVDVLGKPLAKLLPGQFLLLPDEDEVEQYKLISKLMQIAELTGKKDPDLQFRFQRETAFRAKTFIHRLSNMCRIQLADSQDSFSMKLEVQPASGNWTTIAAYEFDNGKIMRHIFSADGSRSSLDIDLPPEISYEMAKQDFCNNWNFYFDCFKRSQAQVCIAASMKDKFMVQS